LYRGDRVNIRCLSYCRLQVGSAQRTERTARGLGPETTTGPRGKPRKIRFGARHLIIPDTFSSPTLEDPNATNALAALIRTRSSGSGAAREKAIAGFTRALNLPPGRVGAFAGCVEDNLAHPGRVAVTHFGVVDRTRYRKGLVVGHGWGPLGGEAAAQDPAGPAVRDAVAAKPVADALGRVDPVGGSPRQWR
jgi:hypothetical protein